ncbi:SAG1386/EF1546 family surface-associated protein [uncultured Limosilactobacillus sp.]|uniref:SAG1386/EF1546 family surface-associated protein n=1 Tax=uncultured Limosilactobacillus sp. TaxID=2837629 RepID=UPI0025D0433B|nr:SAG1386/EF1546 family surface-associated protein [uncultured Limosilactobacillus sp.]
MSERREDQRPENEKLWDKTFDDNEETDSKGNLSRVKRRKKDSQNSRITTILIVLIIILAAAPLFFWVRHEQSFDHPVREERVAQGHTKKTASKKKNVARSSHSKPARHKSVSTSSVSVDDQSSAQSTSVESSSTNSTDSKYATVQAGQGIYRVAANNGLTVSELARLNNISPSSALQPGQRLRVK